MIPGQLVTLKNKAKFDPFLTAYSKTISIWIKHLHEKQNLIVFKIQY